MKNKFFFLFLLFFALMAFRKGEKYAFAIPANWPAPVYDFNSNPLQQNKIILGRILFYDPLLSADSTISCASCHSPYTAFAHTDHALSHGIKDHIGTRNAPALMNLAWKNNFMMDGAIHHLDMQALFPITHPDEMGESMAHVVQKIRQIPLYRNLYREAFGDTGISGERTLKSISQFLLVLVSADSKYDSVMRKQSLFTVQENKGYQLYRQHCSSCHTEPLFTNDAFSYNGLVPDSNLKDKGRMKITGNLKDSLCFKVPSLRNIEVTYPYMHDGRFKSLTEVLRYYSSLTTNPLLPEPLQHPFPFTSDDKVDLTAFLLTLTDKHFLFNADYDYPKKIIEKLSKDSETNKRLN